MINCLKLGSLKFEILSSVKFFVYYGDKELDNLFRILSVWPTFHMTSCYYVPKCHVHPIRIFNSISVTFSTVVIHGNVIQTCSICGWIFSLNLLDVIIFYCWQTKWETKFVILSLLKLIFTFLFSFSNDSFRVGHLV